MRRKQIKAHNLIMSKLPFKEAVCVYYRYVEKKTMKDIGLFLGVGGERVRQRTAKGIRMLRHPSRRKYLIEHMDELSNELLLEVLYN